ncbi:hypothetical protein CDL15_Pgr019267 [Punica granatum]|uniref:Uncharacterized protein n=1 Tax=Punica granatum TaxID=22663 RepID=A0A218Y0V9_PUNGR|nr:hypothetical protein CDL15_Pgr019267 [Punica granatum]
MGGPEPLSQEPLQQTTGAPRIGDRRDSSATPPPGSSARVWQWSSPRRTAAQSTAQFGPNPARISAQSSQQPISAQSAHIGPVQPIGLVRPSPVNSPFRPSPPTLAQSSQQPISA